LRMLRAICVILSLFGSAFGLVAGASADPAGLADIRIASSGRTGATVTITSSTAASVNWFVLADERPRLVMDFAQQVTLPAVASAGVGQVAGIRSAPRAEGQRVVLDLKGPTTILVSRDRVTGASVFTLTPGRRDRFIQLAARGTLTTGLQAASVAVAPGRIPTPSRPASMPTIVLDAGHGGRDSGAVGQSGAHEKTVTLRVARLVADSLRRDGFRVVMTRNDDRFLELEDRVRIARDANADLFISLHADAGPANVAGASVYTLSDNGSRRARSMMENQDWDIPISGEHDRDVEDILVDMAQRETRNRSATFAGLVIGAFQPDVPLLRNTHRAAGFFVLLAPDVPAVLIEMGFMTNRVDEARMLSEAGSTRLADGVYEAVLKHFNRTPSRAPATASAPRR
jgi:N-acetylmuramoyl-L-alanine amidase